MKDFISAITVSSFLFHVVNGLVPPLAERTAAADFAVGLLNGRSPRPTAAPVVPLAVARRNGLAARQLVDYNYNTISTCGFIDGLFSGSIGCTSTGYGCAYWTTTAGGSGGQYYGCCPVSGDTINFESPNCNHAEECLDYNDHTYSSSASGFILSYTGYCGSIAPFCGRILLSSASEQFTNFVCTDTSSIVSMAYDTYSGMGAGSTSSILTDSMTTTTSTYPSSTPSTTPSQTPPEPSPTGKKSNTGAIAGGAVGGVAGLAAIGGLIGYLVYRKRKQRREAVPEVSQYTVHTK